MWQTSAVSRLAVTAAPLAVDLCCGRGGWTRGLVAAGFRVVAVDVLPQPAFPHGDRAHFVQGDVRSLRAHEMRLDGRPLLVVGSPPCQGFSTLRAGNQTPPPVESFELVAAVLRLIAELQPEFWAVENVRGAWKWWAPLLGDPDVKNNPYYLWGNLPDAFRPTGRYPSKLRYRDPGRRSEIPAALAGELASAVLVEARRRELETRPDAALEFPVAEALAVGSLAGGLVAAALGPRQASGSPGGTLPLCAVAGGRVE